jgi:hypothetical protein
MDTPASTAQHGGVDAAKETVMDEITGPEPRRSSRASRWIGAAAAVGIGVTLGAAGIAAAAPDPSPSPSAGSKVAPGAPAPGGPGMPGMRHGHGMRGEGGPGGFGMRGAVHGEFTVPDGTGWRTVAMQRGAVTAVSSTSLTVKSKDGYTKTYVITATTLVNAARDGIGSIKTGDEVAVVATVKSGTATAVDVRDVSQIREQRKQFAPPGGPGGPGAPGPGGPAAPGGTPASPSSYDTQPA